MGCVPPDVVLYDRPRSGFEGERQKATWPGRGADPDPSRRRAAGQEVRLEDVGPDDSGRETARHDEPPLRLRTATDRRLVRQGPLRHAKRDREPPHALRRGRRQVSGLAGPRHGRTRSVEQDDAPTRIPGKSRPEEREEPARANTSAPSLDDLDEIRASREPLGRRGKAHGVLLEGAGGPLPQALGPARLRVLPERSEPRDQRSRQPCRGEEAEEERGRTAVLQRRIGIATPWVSAQARASSYPASTWRTTPIPGSLTRTLSRRRAAASVPSATTTIPA